MRRIDWTILTGTTAGVRPAALLTLAIGVAIGSSLANPAVRDAEPPMPVSAPTTLPSAAYQNLAAVVQKPVRVIPLPLREAPGPDGL